MTDRPLRREVVADILARIFVCALFAALSVSLIDNFMRTGHVTGLLLLASETLVIVLTLIRRRARVVDRTLAAAIVTGVAVAGPTLLRATEGIALLPDAVTATLSVAGLALVVLGKLTLGRSFGIAPALRTVVAKGPYTFMRHPIYTGYVITHAAFLIAHPTAMNLALVIASDVALVLRALREERVLANDAAYREYCQRVRWHLVPRVY
jgi:protein-S-isoprenylcysteine O-methyltransferase Ste14